MALSRETEDDMPPICSPEPRSAHESALIGDVLHLFGGRNDTGYVFPRTEIWTCNIREEKKWIRRFVEGRNIPPPCEGARCVVIKGIMYSYGGRTPTIRGKTKDDDKPGHDLSELFGLNAKNPEKMEWFKVATPIYENDPWQRSYCCLWAIGGKIIMFGGFSIDDIPEDRVQSGAKDYWLVNNEIYEFIFKGRDKEKGCWSDIELSGDRPHPRRRAAVETIDKNRGLLHGGDDGSGVFFADVFVIDLKEKNWIRIDFLSEVIARYEHRLCRLAKAEFKARNCFLLVGGKEGSRLSENAYIYDLDKKTSYVFSINPEIGFIYGHTLHCVEKRDGCIDVIVVGGKDWNDRSKEIVTSLSLGLSVTNEAYLRIESELLDSVQSMSNSSHHKRDIEKMRTEWEARCKSVEEENTKLREELETTKTELRAIQDSNADFLHRFGKIDELIRRPLDGPEEVALTAQAEPEIIGSTGKIQYRYAITRSFEEPKSHSTAKRVCTDMLPVDREVNQKDLVKLASFLRDPCLWKDLYRQLSGEQTDIARIESKHAREPEECPIAMLTEWHNQKASQATVRCIVRALIGIKHLRAAEEVFGKDVVEQVDAKHD